MKIKDPRNKLEFLSLEEKVLYRLIIVVSDLFSNLF